MPLQNRVSPEGNIVAHPARGDMFGNRGGCFHRDDGTLRLRHWASRQWICCVLSFKNRRRKLLTPGLYTELFFLDEATAFAAGHRPCFECRRGDAKRFAAFWSKVGNSNTSPSAPAMDLVLHAERLNADRSKRTERRAFGTVPDGAFVRWQSKPHLVLDRSLLPWNFDGYAAPVTASAKEVVELLTPPTIASIIEAGYRPKLHWSARLA
jgi:hypothetical protein